MVGAHFYTKNGIWCMIGGGLTVQKTQKWGISDAFWCMVGAVFNWKNGFSSMIGVALRAYPTISLNSDLF